MKAKLLKDWEGRTHEFGWHQSLKKGDEVWVNGHTFGCYLTTDIRPIQSRVPPFTVSVPNEILEIIK